ncbi:MAG TPA: tRNA pseudouridine(38-40) synthase TruA [Lentisphaeria bacterium]|nr:MAG: tRNA pseudouridine(38-40) synthase TruA [Lentisphaerae bacterium GWF2_38_69]HBM16681.1 tRNA pseudouridine(38-40) synthase TruA [Lentisphaeria bacterium]
MIEETATQIQNQVGRANFTYLMSVAFDGTGYLGWQIQPHGPTIQSVMEEKLSYLFGSKIFLNSSGRTDAGVHALGMAVSFTPPAKPQIPPETIKRAMNSILPAEIRINSIEIRDQEFNARFDAKGKAYTYVIHNTRKANAFTHRWVWQVADKFNVEAVLQAASYLIGIHDFSSFAVEINKTKKNPIRHIFDIRTDSFGEYICITFLGESFLYKMVRSLMGTLHRVGIEKVQPQKVLEILESRNRLCAYDTAPAKGLFLMEVFYSYGEWKEFKLKELPFFVQKSYRQDC